VVDDKDYIPSGLGIINIRIQDSSTQDFEVLLCHDANFKPLTPPKVTGAWMATEGSGGVGMDAYPYDYPTSVRRSRPDVLFLPCSALP